MYAWSICPDCKWTDLIERDKVYGQLVFRNQWWSDHSDDTQCFWKNSRPAVGIELSKRITPVLSLGTSVMGHINTSSSKTAFDASNVELLSKFNMMNLFAGYPGTPRTFEMEAVVGVGWLHGYVNGTGMIIPGVHGWE